MTSDLFLSGHSADQKLPGDEMLFADEDMTKKNSQQNLARPWRVLIVDDEPEVHQITKLILNNSAFDERPIEFLSAYSGKQALEVLRQESDIAVVLLDVVMETNHAGLDTVKAIRGELNNQLVRIILRTGQPGEAPDSEVIMDYDINDYKEKSELTYNKLFTSVVASLRTYQQLCTIEKCRSGLQKIIEATAQYCKLKSKRDFATELLHQINDLLNLSDNSLYLLGEQKNEQSNSCNYNILAGRGRFSSLTTESLAAENSPLNDELNGLIQGTFNSQAPQSSENYTGFHFISPAIGEHVIIIQKEAHFVPEDLKLLEVFINNTLSAFNNLMDHAKDSAH